MEDLIISVDRKWKKDKYTISNLVIRRGSVVLMKTNCIEDTDRRLTQDMSMDYIKKKKIYGMTAIPAGKYKVVLSYSQKFGAKSAYAWCKGILPEVLNVPGWSGVRIHAGNSAEDSLGCILPGKNNKPGWVSDSMSAVKQMYPLIKDTLQAKGNVWLEINS